MSCGRRLFQGDGEFILPPGGAPAVPGLSPAAALIDAACENARTLSKLCDILGRGPATSPAELAVDGAFILPEEF